jgi:hypothetical protein
MRERGTTALRGWRIDRRTFLKAMGLGGIGLVAGGALATRLAPLVTPVAAQTSPIDELALQLQFDPERIFRFVADQIRYQSYAGLLRGAEGTRLARAGNSVDQAVLLAALLTASGVLIRFVEGELDQVQARRLATASTLDAETLSRRTLEALVEARPDGSVVPPSSLDAETEARVAEALASGDQVLSWVRGQVLDTVDLLESALASAGMHVPEPPADLPDLESQRHVWLQMASGPAWIDLDPSVGGAIGDVLTTPTATMDVLPDELRHRLDFRVIGESVTAGRLVEETLLEASDHADGLVGMPIGFLNIEQDGLQALGADIVSSLSGGTTYLPCLIAGENVVVGPGAVRFGGSGAPIEDVFAAPTGDPGAHLEGEPTAEWLEITLTSPGADPKTVRREVFDRIGPAARLDGSALATLGPAELVPLEPGQPLDFMPAQTSHWLSVESAVVPTSRIERLAAAADHPGRYVTPVQLFHMAQTAGAAALAEDLAGHWFPDAPNIVSFTVTQELDGDQLVVRPLIDIWHRSYGVSPTGVTGTSGSPLGGGVLAHVAERIVFGDGAPGADPAARGPSVGAVFEAARAAALPLRTLTNPEDLADLAFPADTMARLGDALAEGHVVVVPERPVTIGGEERTGWWRIDPGTGHAIDEMDDGRGSDLSQRSALATTLTEAAPPMRRLGACIFFAAATSVNALALPAGLALAAAGGGGVPSALGAALSMAGGASGATSAYASTLFC